VRGWRGEEVRGVERETRESEEGLRGRNVKGAIVYTPLEASLVLSVLPSGRVFFHR
jgi:hypothetical protein